jgi:glycosyltransferase involved in cell wall biosynthesis
MVGYTYYESDNRVRRYAETLVKHGWDVDAVVLYKPGQEKHNSVKNVNVYRIQERRRDEKSKVTYFIRLFRFLIRSGLFLTKRYFTFKKYDLIHIHSIPDYEVFAAIVPKLLGAKIILDIHDIVPELFCTKFTTRTNSPIFKGLLLVERLSTAFADHVIIANHIWHERIVSRSVNKKKCSVIMNFPDNNIFGGIRKSRTDDDFLMIYPGTLSRHQGLEMVIRVLGRIRGRVPRLKFNIYGNGTDENFLKNLTSDLGLTDIIRFHSSLPMEEVAIVMANSDMGIEPKLCNGFSEEAFSTKILEFMLMGVPVVASDTRVHKYYISDDYVKYFKAGDEDELAESIIIFYDNKETRDYFARRASQFVKNMCWNVRCKEYMDIVYSLVPAGKTCRQRGNPESGCQTIGVEFMEINPDPFSEKNVTDNIDLGVGIPKFLKPGTNKGKYVLITAASNEQENIEKTIQKVVSQTILPLQWNIVVNYSTDRTLEIVKSWAERLPWLKLLELPGMRERDFALKVSALEQGIKSIHPQYDYEYIGILDADICLPVNYYEKVLSYFSNNPTLGIAGGTLDDLTHSGKRIKRLGSIYSVPGGVAVFRRECWNSIGGFFPLKWGGEDTTAELVAKKNGWIVKSFLDIKGIHQRKLVEKSDYFKILFNLGKRDYHIGTVPLFEVFKCLRRASERPYLLSTFYRLTGYFCSLLSGETLEIPEELLKFYKQEQYRRLFQGKPSRLVRNIGKNNNK